MADKFTTALNKATKRQNTAATSHPDRTAGDKKVAEAIKTMGEGAFSFASLPIQAMLYSSEAEAALNSRLIADKLLKTIAAGPGFKSRTLPAELKIDHFLRLAKSLSDEPIERTAVRVDELVKQIQENKLQNILQLWMQGDKVTGHEGRHRALALKKLGEDTAPVEITHGNIRWSEQFDPERFDYLPTEQIPNMLVGEDGKFLITDLLRKAAGRSK